MFDIDYIKATNLEDALDFLNTNGAETKILAGGTDIMVDMRSGALKTRFLLDVSRLTDLKKIEIRGGQLCIGAAVTISELLESDTIAEMAPALKKAAEKFASRQIRNVATIGGNVAHCSPCGDTIPPLLIHDAEAVVLTSEGQRHVTIEEMASGPYDCSLHPNEIISHFVLQPRPVRTEMAAFGLLAMNRKVAVVSSGLTKKAMMLTSFSYSWATIRESSPGLFLSPVTICFTVIDKVPLQS